MPQRRRAAALTALTAAATLLLTSLGVPVPAAAAPASPSGLTPSGESVAGIPVLTWDRVAGATSYEVEVSDSPDFDATRYEVTTTNRRAVPTKQLPSGEVWWRVRALGENADSDWSMTSFDRSALAGPTLLGPPDGGALGQPDEPALLSWTPVPGATGYTIEVDDGADFIAAKTYTTKTTSYVVPDPQVATTYHWHVRATLASGIVTEWSEDRTYEIGKLPQPVLTAPADSALTPVEDVVLDWQPVAGAASYDVQVSTDENFNTLAASVSTKATRWSPPVTLDNDQYFWRVRPVDTFGNKRGWDELDAAHTWEFRRHWPDQPVLEHPVDSEVVGDPFFYQWTAIDKASYYELQLSTSSGFQPEAIVDECTTVHTTYVPVGKGDCWPGAAGSYWWRVIAYDDPQAVMTDGIVAAKEHFSYLPDMVDHATASPADGASVQVPTLSWHPVPGAAEYKVFITRVDTGATVVNGTTTAAASFTPRDLLVVGEEYRWQVQTVSASGRLGATLAADAQPTFSVVGQDAAVASEPAPLGPATGVDVHRFPTLTWTPVANASYYQVEVRNADGIAAFQPLDPKFRYPAGEDLGTDWIAPDSTFEWRVSAYDTGGAKLSTGAVSEVDVHSLDAASGPRVALTGVATSQSSTSCTAELEPLGARCEDLRATPVLRWSPVDGAGGYRLFLSADREMTNLFGPSTGIPVDGTMWVPHTGTASNADEALFDSQAGDAFYWEVVPCTVDGQCRPLEHAPWAFNKRSNPVQLQSPADGATVANDVTFTWRDYLETNSDGAAAHLDATGVEPRVAARNYLVQVSTTPNFQTILDSATVDQTTYTAASKAYPEGILYWRVTPIDGSGNQVGATPGTGALAREVRSITKTSPTPTLTSPTGNEVVSGSQPFRWEPMPFAAGYDVEIYRGGDTVGQSANRVFAGSTKQAAFTTTVPVPVSDTFYTWRVRRVDASGNKGAWTSLADPAVRFRVVGTAPTQVSPAAGAVVRGNDALFTWNAVAGAASYRFERRAAGSTSNTEAVTTPALAWAPAKTLADGTWEWRVTGIDADGEAMRGSAWRTFVVDATSPTVTRTAPTGRVARDTDFVVRFSEPVVGVGASTLRIVRRGTTDPLPATVTVNVAGTKAVLDPRRNLRSGTRYTVKVTRSVHDPAGNALVPTSWTVTAR